MCSAPVELCLSINPGKTSEATVKSATRRATTRTTGSTPVTADKQRPATKDQAASRKPVKRSVTGSASSQSDVSPEKRPAKPATRGKTASSSSSVSSPESAQATRTKPGET